MAAQLNPDPPELVDLQRVSARDLDPLLREEVEAWRAELDWDFEKSAELVRHFVDVRALSGYALAAGGRVVGYLYYVLEDRKGLIGDLFVTPAYRGGSEDRLLTAAVERILGHERVSRIESQLLMLDHEPGRVLPGARYASSFDRNFMRVDLGSAALGEGRVRRPLQLENWSDHYQDAAAELIAQAYRGHVDSRINDQYRSVTGARRFLFNIVQYPGCGTFFRPASYAAFEGAAGKLCGVSLASMVSRRCGHITQICVSPEVKGTGIGHALLRQSLIVLRDMGSNAATLTVTSANDEAVSLYERVGFRTVRKFSAYAWEGFAD